MKKALIALGSDFSNEVFKDNFFKEGFQVATSANGKEALEIIKTEAPDIIVADINLPEIGGLELLDKLKEKEETKRIPVIIYSRTGAQKHREDAMDHEARDFVIGLSDSPHNVVLKAKTHLGEQKAYLIPLPKESEISDTITRDLGLGGGPKCPSCSSGLSLHLLRNLNLGKNTFKVSIVCPKCEFRSTTPSEEN